MKTQKDTAGTLLSPPTCSAFDWARYNDATVNQMLVGGSPLTNIIGVLTHEKAELIKRIAELELIAPKKITMPDGSVMVYRAPAHLLPNENILPLGVERMSEAQCSSPSAPGGNPLPNVKVVAPPSEGGSQSREGGAK